MKTLQKLVGKHVTIRLKNNKVLRGGVLVNYDDCMNLIIDDGEELDQKGENVVVKYGRLVIRGTQILYITSEEAMGGVMGMARTITINTIDRKPVSELNVELVERKGLGHPDYIADASAEAVSKALSNYYLEKYGVILHHNVDKVLVVGGQANPRFGGGDIIQPIYILVAGRVTTEVKTATGVEKVPLVR